MEMKRERKRERGGGGREREREREESERGATESNPLQQLAELFFCGCASGLGATLVDLVLGHLSRYEGSELA